MNRRPLIAGNWKMHLTLSEAVHLAQTIAETSADCPDRDILVAPAFTALANPGKELLPGMVCKVEISAGIKSGAIVVPLGLIRVAADGRKFVWVVEGDTAGKVYVTTGEARGNGVEILNGLHPGIQIITEGYQKVSEGEKIVRS